jgi:hypothetical protein
MVARDDGAADATHRLRIGLYTFDDGPQGAAPNDPSTAPSEDSRKDPRT